MNCAIGDDIVVDEVFVVVDATGLIAVVSCLFVVVDLVDMWEFAAMAALDSYQK